jgi:hypothetical protein
VAMALISLGTIYIIKSKVNAMLTISKTFFSSSLVAINSIIKVDK